MDPSRWRARTEAAFDTYLSRVEAVTHLERRRMKALLATVGLTSVALMVDAVLILQGVATGTRSPIQDWWPQLVAVGTGLVAFASLRVAVKAHQQYVDAQLKLKAEKGEVVLQFERLEAANARMERDVQEVRNDVSAFRKEFNDYALSEARRHNDPRSA